MATTVQVVPEQCAEIARLYMINAQRLNDQGGNLLPAAIHEFEQAAKWFDNARGASIGHNRRDRYEEAASACRKKAAAAQAAYDKVVG